MGVIGCGIGYYAGRFLGVGWLGYLFIFAVGTAVLAWVIKLIFKLDAFLEHIIASIIWGFLLGLFFNKKILPLLPWTI